MMEYIDIKFALVYYLIGRYKSDDLIRIADEKIHRGDWSDELADLSFPSNISYKNITILLKYGIYKISGDEMSIIENNIYSDSLVLLSNQKSKWKQIESQIVHLIKLKKEIFELTSNDMASNDLELIDDFELRTDGYSGLLDMPADLIHILQSKLK